MDRLGTSAEGVMVDCNNELEISNAFTLRSNKASRYGSVELDAEYEYDLRWRACRLRADEEGLSKPSLSASSSVPPKAGTWRVGAVYRGGSSSSFPSSRSSSSQIDARDAFGTGRHDGEFDVYSGRVVILSLVERRPADIRLR